MEGKWAYNERGNMRQRALKRVQKLVESLQIEPENACDGDVGLNVEAASESEAAGRSDCDTDGEESEVSETFEADFSRFDDSDEMVTDQTGESGESPVDLRSSLADWAIEFGISLIALSALLSILTRHHPFLPKDGRTLLKTKTKYNIENLAGGTFHYFGVVNAFQWIFNSLYSVLPDGHTFRLQLNFDGLPLFKSTGTQFWPILGMLQGYSNKPAVIGIFCGSSKPNSLSQYLRHLIDELKILGTGFAFKGKTFVLNVSSIVCDTPARAFIRAVKSHTAYHGCDKCHQSGIRVGSRMTFPEVSARRRTDKCFRDGTDEDHHHEGTPFSNLHIDMVATFPLDYMHLVCLGVMRRLLDLWLGPPGPLCCRLSSSQASLVSERLLSLKDYIPSEFARRPRPLADKNRWKATELRQFLLYTGPVVLKEVLKPQIYDNFMLFSVGVHILASSEHCLQKNDLADSLLVSFVQHFGALYGEEFLVYNVHCLVHLSQDVKSHGNLDMISGFPYENFLGQLKKLVRGPCNALTQVVRRLSEIDSLNHSTDLCRQSGKKYTVEHQNGPAPHSDGGDLHQFKVLSMDGFTVKTSKRDSCIKVGDEVVLVENFIIDGEVEYIAGREYRSKDPFFVYPFDSRALGIFKVSNLATSVKYFLMGDNVQKYIRLPYYNDFVVVPLLHSCESH